MKPIKQKEPRLLTLLFTAFSGISLGLTLGIFLLLTKAPTKVAQLPEPDQAREPGDYQAYYATGKVAPAETPNLRSGLSRIQRRTVGPISFSEEELNYFIGTFKGQEAKPAEGAPARRSDVEQLNFHLAGERMIATFKVVIDPQGDRFEMLVQADVTFENSDAGPELAISSMKINALPVPSAGGALTSMVESKLREAALPEDLVKMWQNIRKLDVESGKLIVEVGLRRPVS